MIKKKRLFYSLERNRKQKLVSVFSLRCALCSSDVQTVTYNISFSTRDMRARLIGVLYVLLLISCVCYSIRGILKNAFVHFSNKLSFISL